MVLEGEEEPVEESIVIHHKSQNESFWQKHIGQIAVLAILVTLIGFFWVSNEANSDRMNDQYNGIRSDMTTEFGNIKQEFRSIRNEFGGVREELNEIGKGVASLERRLADPYRYEDSELKIVSNTQP